MRETSLGAQSMVRQRLPMQAKCCQVNERVTRQSRTPRRRLTCQQNEGRLKTQQRLRVAIRKGAQKGDKADQGRRPPVGQTAE
jgi:hypothetical protein